MREVAVKEDNKIAKTVQLVRTLYPHLERVPDIEIQKAIALSKHLGLDPLKREVHFVPYGRQVQLVISYLEYIKRGERSHKLDGWSIKFEGKTKEDLKAVVTIYRKDWKHPLEWTVYFKEVARNTPSWESMPLFMLRKVAICQAFRLAFPEETSSLPYEEAEIIGEIAKEDIPMVNPETGEIIEVRGEDKKEEPREEVKVEEVEEVKIEEEQEERASEKQLKYLFSLMTDAGMPFVREKRLEWVREKLGREIQSFANLSKSEAKMLIDTLQRLIAEKN